MIKILKNSLLSGINSSGIVSSRSISLFKRPGGETSTKKDDDDDDDFEEPVPEKFSFIDEEEKDPELEKERLEKIRNKSRLWPQHRNMLFNMKPYDQAQSWIHTTLKYQRTMYGRLGKASGFDPRICFYTPTELAEKQQYEKVAYPYTIQEVMALNAAEKKEKADAIRIREETIAANIKKLGQWKADFIAKRDKKEEDSRTAKERKDRLIEEVRRHLGYTVHAKDERFKELLEKKEKEQKKALKEAKRQQKEAKMLEKIVSSNKSLNEDIANKSDANQ